jgi:hypothetical protein
MHSPLAHAAGVRRRAICVLRINNTTKNTFKTESELKLRNA